MSDRNVSGVLVGSGARAASGATCIAGLAGVLLGSGGLVACTTEAIAGLSGELLGSGSEFRGEWTTSLITDRDGFPEWDGL